MRRIGAVAFFVSAISRSRRYSATFVSRSVIDAATMYFAPRPGTPRMTAITCRWEEVSVTGRQISTIAVMLCLPDDLETGAREAFEIFAGNRGT